MATSTEPVSLYNQLFPVCRDRVKEQEAAKRFVPQVPSYLGSVPIGFEPGWMTSSMILCPAIVEYRLADWMVPYLYACGLDTPNKVTLFNCFTVRLLCLFCAVWGGNEHGLGWCWALVGLLPLQMVLDGADGQMARRYGLGSDFGASLDATTDNLFAITFGIIAVYRASLLNRWFPPTFLLLVFMQFAFFGNAFIASKTQNLHWNEMNIWHKLGTYQVLYLSYYYMVLMTASIYLGWWQYGFFATNVTWEEHLRTNE